MLDSPSKVPAEANRAVVYLEGERVADSKSPKLTRGDVVRGKFGNGSFRIDYLEGKFRVGSETIEVHSVEEAFRPSDKPAPDPVPVVLPPEPEPVRPALEWAGDEKLRKVRERCDELRSAVDLYESACRASLLGASGSDAVDAAKMLEELVELLPENFQASCDAASLDPSPTPIEIEPPKPALAILPQQPVKIAPPSFADKIGAVQLPEAYPNLHRHLNGRVVVMIGGQVDPPKQREIAEMLSLPVDRVLCPVTGPGSNHHAVHATEQSIKNGKVGVVFVLEHLFPHSATSALRRACALRSVPIELVGKGGTGRFRASLSRIEETLKVRLNP